MVYCDEDVTLIDADGVTYNLKRGENRDFALTLYQGINYFRTKGNGTIAMHYNNEVMA